MSAACDCHIHILDPAFATVAGAAVPAGMTVADYRAAQPVLGTGRVVVVQAKNYGKDNACLVDALRRFGPDGRGIAVVDREVSDDELDRLHAAGVRGVRFSLWHPGNAVASRADVSAVARRIAPLGWHVQLHMRAEQIIAARAELERLPCDMVIDHMGRLPPGPDAPAHPAFDLLRGLAADGRAWIKLSGPYLNRREGPQGAGDAARIARAWIDAAPQRLVWGSDWPHVTEQGAPPAPAAIAATLRDWCEGDARLIETIGIRTPEALYGFEARQ